MSRLYARSKNHDMDMTLDYNVELFPLQEGQSVAMALASSLMPSGRGDAVEGEDKDRHVWRPDGKGVKGLEEEYDYVMYGKVSSSSQGQVSMNEHRRRCTNSTVEGKLCTSYVMVSRTGHLYACRTVYASFGGLLLSLTGSFRHMTGIVLGDPLYILLRK